MIADAVLTGLNHVLGQSAWARERLAPFAGCEARLEIAPWQLSWRVGATGLCEKCAPGAAPDVKITLPARSALGVLLDREKALQAARVEGSAEFATALAFVLKNLRWDFEEDLAQAVGDIAAHRLAHGLGALQQWPAAAASKLAENLAEYLTEESRLLPSRPELAALSAEVAALEQALTKLERRL